MKDGQPRFLGLGSTASRRDSELTIDSQYLIA